MAAGWKYFASEITQTSNLMITQYTIQNPFDITYMTDMTDQL